MAHTATCVVFLYLLGYAAYVTAQSDGATMAKYDEHRAKEHHDNVHMHKGSGHDMYLPLTVVLNTTNTCTFDIEGGFSGLAVGANGILRCTFSQEGAVGDVIMTGVFLKTYPYFYSNEVVTVQFTDGDFKDSTLTAAGRLKWSDGMTAAGGQIVTGFDTVVITGGSGAWLGAIGTIKFEGGQGGDQTSSATVHALLPKHLVGLHHTHY